MWGHLSANCASMPSTGANLRKKRVSVAIKVKSEMQPSELKQCCKEAWVIIPQQQCESWIKSYRKLNCFKSMLLKVVLHPAESCGVFRWKSCLLLRDFMFGFSVFVQFCDILAWMIEDSLVCMWVSGPVDRFVLWLVCYYWVFKGALTAIAYILRFTKACLLALHGLHLWCESFIIHVMKRTKYLFY